jgi:hypothetical protein
LQITNSVELLGHVRTRQEDNRGVSKPHVHNATKLQSNLIKWLVNREPQQKQGSHNRPWKRAWRKKAPPMSKCEHLDKNC